MKVTLTLELSEADIQRISENSIERVMNNAIFVGQHCEDNKDVGEEASTLWQDCEELKPIVRRIWWTVQQEIFKEKLRS